MNGFKKFLMRGNVLDLAVAVVIGAAFTNIVNALVKGVINPIVGAFGTTDLTNYKSCLSGSCTQAKDGTVTHGIYILWGDVVSAALSFLITAAVVYFLFVLPMNRLMARYMKPAEVVEEKPVEAEIPAQATADSREIALLAEIRDLLEAQRNGQR
ncbi:large conductance mechanosensitive channel protein MscL [Phaeacidiphilus oryzae]|jgi:large conductance mechanosensitive channel|uniref:large conductance mechanosensitive channel protein MscL n=1 Tax=Phaeacidiphilus oryzae TaxID=348818 RepID=UPI00068D38F8|nr:large conductance mechanosensitive channel protein MscL [Phaeacidiphilus oryzae]